MKIKNIHAYEILASGGYPTLEARVELEDGSLGIASVPYGASAGSHEATVMTDGDVSRWSGKGMQTAILNIYTKITPALHNLDASNQRLIDETLIKLDGTSNKARLGGNAMLAVSLAVAKSVAASKGLELYEHLIQAFSLDTDLSHLPQPMVVVIEGGKHAVDTTDLQEYCLTATRHDTAENNIRMVLETYHQLAKVLAADKLSTNVGNEGAFAPSGITSNEKPFEYMLEAIKQAGYKPGSDLAFSIDAAANEFFDGHKYHLKLENQSLTSDQLITYYSPWLTKYPLASIEDMLAEDDWVSWSKLKQIADNHNLPLVGDDLTVTNISRLNRAIRDKAISAILIKLNQIGTLTETIDCCKLAKVHGLMTITSHRGGGDSLSSSRANLDIC